jgi:DNA-binding beta-propeller fold protein YncE
LASAALIPVIGIAPAMASAPQPAPYHTVGAIAGTDGSWDFSALDASSGRLYIARGDAISVADLAGKTFTALAPAHRGHQVLVLDNGTTLFETNGGTNLARFIDAHSGAILAEIPVGTDPDAALFDHATGLVAVMNAGDGTISLIDPVKRVAVGQIKVGGSLEYAVADGAGTLFVNIEDGNAIARVDLLARKLLKRIALPGCEGPTGLALVGGSSRLITACANKVALVVNAATGATMATLPIGAGPDAVLADEARGLAFVPCGDSGTLVELSILDRNHISVVGTITTQTSARSGVIDRRDGRIYLPTAQFGPVAPGKKHGDMVPGSFALLILAPGA